MPTIDRRSLLLSAAAATALAAPWPAGAAAGPVPADVVFLNRLTFGATPALRADLAQRGRAGWLDAQMALPPDGPEITARLQAQRLRIAYGAGMDELGRWPAADALRPLAWLSPAADQAQAMRLAQWDRPMAWPERVRPADEVIAAALVRAVHAPAQLREVMTQFWHDHFSVHAMKDELTAALFPAHDRVLRAHALGNFRDLLGAVARSPSMLAYLNNADSRASPANENFARELLELHTLGAAAYLNARHAAWETVPGAMAGRAEGYIDDDVWEVARAFTGWSVGDGRWLAEGVTAPETGLFHYVDAWHDPYQKRVLGRALPPMAAPMADGEAVLDLLARHPATARHICTKIARRLLADDPAPALVARLAGVFLDATAAPDQIGRVVRALALDPAFEAPPEKRRRPFEFLAALYRASGVTVAPRDGGPVWHLARAGWTQHLVGPPTGHPDRAADWGAGTILLRQVELALFAHDDWFGATTDRLADRIPAGVTTAGALAAFWSDRLQGRPEGLGVGLGVVLDTFGLAPDAALPDAAGDLHGLSATLLAFAALSPQALFR
jgi:uncharacterized protein (DUF1800 family)